MSQQARWSGVIYLPLSPEYVNGVVKICELFIPPKKLIPTLVDEIHSGLAVVLVTLLTEARIGLGAKAQDAERLGWFFTLVPSNKISPNVTTFLEATKLLPREMLEFVCLCIVRKICPQPQAPELVIELPMIPRAFFTNSEPMGMAFMTSLVQQGRLPARPPNPAATAVVGKTYTLLYDSPDEDT
jgi:hypothetical protein